MSTTQAAETTGLWHGLIALGQHIQAHQLPDFVEVVPEPDHLDVKIHSTHAEAWLNTLHTDQIHSNPGWGNVRHITTESRLPETGVRIQLSWTRLGETRPEPAPAPVAETVAEVVEQLDPTELATCDDCGAELDVTHGAERGQSLCGECCHAGNPCSWRACCEEGAIR